jgi:nucleotide-binding universal stress UspA family protein
VAYLKTQVARLRNSGVHSYGMLLNEPDPAETIADRISGDQLVMATHGHDRIRRTLLSSVTDKEVSDAVCPVMVIPPLQLEKERAVRWA